MIDLRSLKGLLAGMAAVSRINYQILDNKGAMIFSTRGEVPVELSGEELHHLSDHVIGQKVFRYKVCDGHNFLCGIPLRNGQEILGALVAFGQNLHRSARYDAGHAAEASHAGEMENFLGHLTTFYEENLSSKEEIEEMAQELDQSFENLYMYAKIATQIKTLRFSGGLLENVIKELLENMRADAAFSLLPDRQRYDIQVVKPQAFDQFSAQENFIEKLINMIPLDAPMLEENYFIINDSRKNSHYKDLAADPYRFLAVRIQHQEEFYGWLGLVSFNLNEIFRQGELKLLISMAEQLAVVIANTDLYKDLEQFIINMVKSLVFAIEAKDMYTRGHSERVSKYSLFMGARFDLNEKEYNNLKWASILHDIGKIGIPENILNKPDHLSDTENEIIKEHPEKGAEILKPVDQLADSLPGILHHHERYDGGGYPQGLKGREIPLVARIIAVADTFDALNSTRAYRGRKSPEESLKTVKEVAGSQLDPRIVEVFAEVYEKDLQFKQEKNYVK